MMGQGWGMGLRELLWLLGSVVVTGTLFGCSAPGSRGGLDGSSDRVGAVSLAFSVPAGLTIDQVSYAITGPTSVSSTVDVSHAQRSIEFVVGPLLAGSGYAIVLRAEDTAGDPCVSAATPFVISTGTTTQLPVTLVCTVGDSGVTFADAGTGSLEVDASVTVVQDPSTVCPVIAGITISPAEEVVGATSAVSVVTAPAGAALSYAVTPTDPGGLGNGSLSALTASGATFTCASAGQVRLTATTTAPLAGGAGSCPPQSMSALITCEAVNDGGTSGPFAALMQAPSVDLGTGDLNGDGIPEIVMTPGAAPPSALAPGVKAAAAVSLAITPAPQGAVVFTHDSTGQLVLASDLAAYDFSLVQSVASLPESMIGGALTALDADSSSGGCGFVDDLIGLAGTLVNFRLAVAAAVDGLVEAVLGTFVGPAITDNPDEDFFTCVVSTPQTPIGCFAIQVILALEAACDLDSLPGCDLVARRPHCYQVAPEGMTACATVPARSILCDKTTDTTGCCNLDFIFNTALFGDIRNQAPNPITPASGPFTIPTQAILAGPALVQLFPLLTEVGISAPAAAQCGLGGLTHNPVDIFANPTTTFALRNGTRPGHILEGNVDQFVTEDGAGVYTSIVGSSLTAARLGGFNEREGPLILGTVRDKFVTNVGGALKAIAENQLCCAGGQLMGGTISFDANGMPMVAATASPPPVCSFSGDDGGAPDEGGDDSEAGPTLPAPPGTGGTALGDPHLRTFDGLRYDCQPEGEETLAVADSSDLEVQVRTAPFLNRNVAVTVAVAARVGTDRVAFYLDGTTTHNGIATTFAPGMNSLSGGASVWALPGAYVVIWPDNSQLRLSVNGAFFGSALYIADARRGHVTGLLGNANSNVDDDLVTRGGTTPLTSPVPFRTFYGTYVESWRVTQATSLFDYGDAQSTETFTDRSFPHILEDASTLTAAQVQVATSACQAAGVSSDWMDACLLDFTVSGGDMQFVQALAEAPAAPASFQVLSPCAACSASQACCNGVCTSTAVDGANCGVCGNVCTAGGATCSAGVCGCNAPKSALCGQDAGTGSCADLTSDTQNCGRCGVVCSGSTPVCSGGTCVTQCNTASGQTLCGEQCVTLGDDHDNCGACVHACASSEVCSGGVCTAFGSIDPVGCADGTREVFANQTSFPAIAACAGGWDGNGGAANYSGVFPAPLRTTNPGCSQNGNSGPNANGKGCSASDLCSLGWHICMGGEVLARVKGSPTFDAQTDGCAAAVWPANSFFAAAIGSTGCSICAEPYFTETGAGCTNSSCAQGCQANPAITNDLFGCGTEGIADSSCGDVDRASNNVCQSLDRGWSCGSDGVRESVFAVHNPAPAGSAPSGGGVLCCQDM